MRLTNLNGRQALSLSKRLQYSVGRGNGHKTFLFALIIVASTSIAVIRYSLTKTDNPTQPAVLGVSNQTQTFNAVYIVQKGDTVFSLAKQHSINWEDLTNFNNLQPPYSLLIGQQLMIPVLR